ncbi:hypothetical protein [Bordetella bronchialis]|uniref:Uncharacterized protein n=1 Tax=Bordetella bronchialis TaxID=463025 RepID=A0ABM6CTZ2_9BORD|nr:hypothetical protein [Bordetella bronchialis]ANN67564.1 hypothetical protein BAU06_15760 [Bordetella bronchialis]
MSHHAMRGFLAAAVSSLSLTVGAAAPAHADGAKAEPVRVRVERLGYKQAKYVERIEIVDSFAGLWGGNGGYWEDRGYEWYAGI